MTIIYHPLPRRRVVCMSWEIRELEVGKFGLLEVVRHEDGVERRVGTAESREFAWGIAEADRAYMHYEADRVGAYLRDGQPVRETACKVRQRRWFRR